MIVFPPSHCGVTDKWFYSLQKPCSIDSCWIGIDCFVVQKKVIGWCYSFFVTSNRKCRSHSRKNNYWASYVSVHWHHLHYGDMSCISWPPQLHWMTSPFCGKKRFAVCSRCSACGKPTLIYTEYLIRWRDVVLFVRLKQPRKAYRKIL